jgi:hypothetical protein
MIVKEDGQDGNSNWRKVKKQSLKFYRGGNGQDVRLFSVIIVILEGVKNNNIILPRNWMERNGPESTAESARNVHLLEPVL